MRIFSKKSTSQPPVLPLQRDSSPRLACDASAYPNASAKSMGPAEHLRDRSFVDLIQPSAYSRPSSHQSVWSLNSNGSLPGIRSPRPVAPQECQLSADELSARLKNLLKDTTTARIHHRMVRHSTTPSPGGEPSGEMVDERLGPVASHLVYIAPPLVDVDEQQRLREAEQPAHPYLEAWDEDPVEEVWEGFKMSFMTGLAVLARLFYVND